MLAGEYGSDCAANCYDRECAHLKELPDGQVVAVTCAGKCAGKCLGVCENAPGRIENNPAIAPDSKSRLTVRSTEMEWDRLTTLTDGEQYECSCAVGCVVGHPGSEVGAGCYGSCVGICFGLAQTAEVFPPTRVRTNSKGHTEPRTKNPA